MFTVEVRFVANGTVPHFKNNEFAISNVAKAVSTRTIYLEWLKYTPSKIETKSLSYLILESFGLKIPTNQAVQLRQIECHLISLTKSILII